MKTLLALFFCANVLAGEVILTFGDSVTSCTPPPAGSCPLSESETFRYHIASAFSATVINGGVSGDSTADALGKLSPLLDSHNPDFVIIMFGLNDEIEAIPVSIYERNLITFIRLSKRSGAKVVLMTPNATREFLRNQRLKPYVNAARDVAKRFKVKLVDNYKSFAEYAIESVVAEGGVMSNLTYDAIHPNATGQQLIANRIIESFMTK